MGLPWYAGKTAIEGYLKEINRERKVSLRGRTFSVQMLTLS